MIQYTYFTKKPKPATSRNLIFFFFLTWFSCFRWNVLSEQIQKECLSCKNQHNVFQCYFCFDWIFTKLISTAIFSWLRRPNTDGILKKGNILSRFIIRLFQRFPSNPNQTHFFIKERIYFKRYFSLYLYHCSAKLSNVIIPQPILNAYQLLETKIFISLHRHDTKQGTTSLSTTLTKSFKEKKWARSIP